jgi:ribosomal protein S18 acetylase RimI-like enzyme
MISPAASEILIRPAHSGDAAFVADMFYLSMGKLADYLFENAKQPVHALIKKLIIRNAGRFGSDLSFVAEREGRPLGVLVACEGAQLDSLNLSVLPHIFPVLGLSPALNFLWRGYKLPGGREAEKDEYYISNLGVPASSQGLGIGSRLLAFAEQKAKSVILKKCALVVGLYNKNALRLYQRHGYQIVETISHPNEYLGYHRMVKQLS